VPTANPGAARRLNRDGQLIIDCDFSDDSRQIVYVKWRGGRGTEVVIEQVDGSGYEVIATGDWFDRAAFVPGQKQLILVRPDRVSLLSLDDRKEQELLVGDLDRPTFLWFASSGQKAVFGYSEAPVWHLLDLKKGTTRSLGGLEGYHPIWARGRRWLIFDDVPSLTFGEGGVHFVTLDLESGETSQVLALGEDTKQWALLPQLSLDGKYALVYQISAVAPTSECCALWLLRANNGKARLLAKAGRVNGALSPDGRWVAVSIIERTDDRMEAKLTLMETERDGIRSLGEGFGPIWVGP